MRPSLRPLAAALLLAAPCTLAAQAPAAAHPIAVEDAVRSALGDNTQVRIAWLRVEQQRGTVISRQSPFDLQFSSSVQGMQQQVQVTDASFARQAGKTYQLGLSRQLRSGITVSPSVQVSDLQYALPGAQASGSSTASMDVGVPLLYNRGGAVTATAVRVGELDLATFEGSWRTAVAAGANSAASAYWGYVAAIRRLDVQREAEARAARLLDETTQLVKQEERAPADLQQLKATVASRRAARILAEQAVDEARVQLGSVMGLTAAATLALGAPSTDFPVPPAGSVADDATVARLRGVALRLRPDLAAQRVSNEAWDTELEQFRSASLPHLDLHVAVGYVGLTEGPGYAHLVSPLYRNVPGLNASVQLSYAWAASNSGPRGQVVSEEALVQQQRVSMRDVERQVVTDVAVAAAGVDRNAAALRDAEEAVALYRLSVDNEQRKLKLGMNTLFDVLNSEDALTNALLTAINNRRGYAAALTSLRLATGTLVEVAGEQPAVDAARLLTVP